MTASDHGPTRRIVAAGPDENRIELLPLQALEKRGRVELLECHGHLGIGTTKIPQRARDNLVERGGPGESDAQLPDFASTAALGHLSRVCDTLKDCRNLRKERYSGPC